MRWPAWVLLVVGLMQMTGDLLGLPWLKGLAAATAASPAPKVFSAVRGYETYSTRFVLELTDASGAQTSVPLTGELYARLRGPYNRRNVYGAVLSYGPVLPEALRAPVMRHALCGGAPLLEELGLGAQGAKGARVRYEMRPGTDLAGLPTVLEPGCP
jgi:hypothetical protein